MPTAPWNTPGLCSSCFVIPSNCLWWKGLSWRHDSAIQAKGSNTQLSPGLSKKTLQLTVQLAQTDLHPLSRFVPRTKGPNKAAAPLSLRPRKMHLEPTAVGCTFPPSQFTTPFYHTSWLFYHHLYYCFFSSQLLLDFPQRAAAQPLWQHRVRGQGLGPVHPRRCWHQGWF